VVLRRDKEDISGQDRSQLLYHGHAGDINLPGLVSYIKGRTLKRNQLFKNMVFRQRQRLANHDPTTHKSWKDETPLVGRIPLEDISKHILVRGVGLSALGKLDGDTIKLAARLEIPHHEGAGGVEDFEDRESFQKHVRRVSNRLKRKR
jgi:hypothetical protein